MTLIFVDLFSECFHLFKELNATDLGLIHYIDSLQCNSIAWDL